MAMDKYIMRKILTQSKLESNVNNEIKYSNKVTAQDFVRDVKPLKMKELRSIFFTYFAGISLASLVFLIELFVYRSSRVYTL